MSISNDQKRILLVAATPADEAPIQVNKEFREIEQGLELSKNTDLFALKQISATRYQDLRRQLNNYQPHIVHFSGHGVENGILLEDDQGNAQLTSTDRLAKLLSLTNQQQQLECIILNTCNSQTTAKTLSDVVSYSIGMNAPIDDRAAIQFAIDFYNSIGDGLGYEQAFQFADNAISYDTAKPLLFSQGSDESAKTLSQNEQDFVQQVFSQHNQGVPQVILSQQGRDTALMAQQLKEEAQQCFAAERILHFHPPINPNTKESIYFRQLGRQCRFPETCCDSTEWAGLLEDKLYDGKPLFLLIQDFETGNDDSRHALAGELRQLQEIYAQQLSIIIFGGEKLAELVFAAGDLSLLNHANTQYVPELTVNDLQQLPNAQRLDKKTLLNILSFSGGHPDVIRHLINQGTQQNYQQCLQQSPLASQWFSRYKTNADCTTLCYWLQQSVVEDFEHWPMNLLLREFYWRNLLMRDQGQFCWRSKIIREMGCKVLGCS